MPMYWLTKLITHIIPIYVHITSRFTLEQVLVLVHFYFSCSLWLLTSLRDWNNVLLIPLCTCVLLHGLDSWYSVLLHQHMWGHICYPRGWRFDFILGDGWILFPVTDVGYLCIHRQDDRCIRWYDLVWDWIVDSNLSYWNGFQDDAVL